MILAMLTHVLGTGTRPGTTDACPDTIPERVTLVVRIFPILAV